MYFLYLFIVLPAIAIVRVCALVYRVAACCRTAKCRGLPRRWLPIWSGRERVLAVAGGCAGELAMMADGLGSRLLLCKPLPRADALIRRNALCRVLSRVADVRAGNRARVAVLPWALPINRWLPSNRLF